MERFLSPRSAPFEEVVLFLLWEIVFRRKQLEDFRETTDAEYEFFTAGPQCFKLLQLDFRAKTTSNGVVLRTACPRWPGGRGGRRCAVERRPESQKHKKRVANFVKNCEDGSVGFVGRFARENGKSYV